MIQKQQKKHFRSQFVEKLMDLGNIIVAAFILSQFISEKKFSFLVFTLGTVLAMITYIISYLISD